MRPKPLLMFYLDVFTSTGSEHSTAPTVTVDILRPARSFLGGCSVSIFFCLNGGEIRDKTRPIVEQLQ